MKNRFFLRNKIFVTGASLNLNSNMKTKTHIQFFSSNFDVLLEQNNPDLAVPFSSKQTSHIVSTITTTATKQGCSRPDQIFIMIWKLSEYYYLKIIWKLSTTVRIYLRVSAQWFIPTNLSLLSFMLWWQLWKLSSFKMNDLWATCRFWLTHRAPHPSPKDCCVMGT